MKATITLKNDRKLCYKNVTSVDFNELSKKEYIYICYSMRGNERGIRIYKKDIKNIDLIKEEINELD